MKLNLAIKKWDYYSPTLGALRIYPVSMKALAVVQPHLREPGPYGELSRALLLAVGRRRTPDDKNEDLSESDVKNLETDELNNFVETFLLKDRSSLPNEEGDQVDKKPSQDQQAEDRLRHYLNAMVNRVAAASRSVLESIKSSYSIPNIGEQLASSISGPASALGDLYKSIYRQSDALMDAYDPPPILETVRPFESLETASEKTNTHLESMSRRMATLLTFGENAIIIMTQLQAASGEFLKKFSEEAEANTKSAKTAIGVGVLAIFLTAFQIIYTEAWSGPEDEARLEAALVSIRADLKELRDQIGASDQELASTLQQDRNALADAIDAISRLSTAERDVAERSLSVLEALLAAQNKTNESPEDLESSE